MIGLIHMILFDTIESLAGAEAVREVKRRAGVGNDRVFGMNEVCDDAEWQRLLGAACDVLGVTQAQAEEVYADQFVRDAQRRWPAWFAMARTAREFLERQPGIHNTFATSVLEAARQAVVDKFAINKDVPALPCVTRRPTDCVGYTWRWRVASWRTTETTP